MTPHRVWCERQAQNHASCYWRVATIDLGADARLVVEVNQSAGVPLLVSLTVDRGPRRTLVPMTRPQARELAAAIASAVELTTM
ncbi:MAG TPA: hypothetical protein VH561_00950 [Micromonosporaceae bacterium]